MQEKGFAHIAVIVVLIAIGAVLFFLYPKNNLTTKNSPINSIITKVENNSGVQLDPLNPKEDCPDPFVFQMPIDLDKATSILYPGQIRGGDYKAHGGFRFDGYRTDEIKVVAPFDAFVIAGARYPMETGEIQYTFDFAHPCGVQYRFGHLLTLSSKFAEIAEGFPLPEILDSRTTQVTPPVEVKQGELIATAVGVPQGGPAAFGGVNTFVDWGVYDYRTQNEATKDPNWPTKYLNEDSSWGEYHDSDTYKYAVCWFEWLSEPDREKVLALPSSDSEHGKQSDFCI